MASEPVSSDNARDLWRKIATNWYDYAIALGGTGMTPPSWNDSVVDLQRKVAYSTALLVTLKP